MEKMAIIKDVGIGLRDAGVPILWFTVYVSECGAALQIFNWNDAGKLIKEAGVYAVTQLEGKPCLVDEDNQLIKFVRILKI